jgi:ureidoacrylate peracid hydrolase
MWNAGWRDAPSRAPKPCDIVTTEHWCSSGLARNDSGLQLKQHGIRQIIMIRLAAHTCLEATVRYATEPGYGITAVRDATADRSDKEMHAALEVNIPGYATAIATTNEIIDMMSSAHALELGGH